jgi:hypothetical protein
MKNEGLQSLGRLAILDAERQGVKHLPVKISANSLRRYFRRARILHV